MGSLADWPAAPAYVVGENILIFGAGPVGRAGAACARLLGAGAIIVADYIQERLDLLKPHGVETINLSDGVPIENHLERITGHREVDRVIDYVGVDCRGFGAEADKIVESAVTNAMLKYVRFGGMTSTVGCTAQTRSRKTRKPRKAIWIWNGPTPGSSRRECRLVNLRRPTTTTR
jgi:glutathione-independent formaldehyde dehydrogenase